MKGEWLDWVILWVFSNLSDSMILSSLLDREIFPGGKWKMPMVGMDPESSALRHLPCLTGSCILASLYKYGSTSLQCLPEEA